MPTYLLSVYGGEAEFDAVKAKEQLGGFWVIKAPELDAALSWARDGSAACQGPVEVHPFQDDVDD